MMMRLYNLVLSLAFLLSTITLHGQWLHFGVDEVVGVHYNTLDARSYKTPIANAGFGARLTIADPYNPMPFYFRGRLGFEADIQTRRLSGNTRQDFNFRDLISSFQVHKKLNEKLSVYAAINLSFNVMNIVQVRQGGTIFTGERVPALEDEIRQRIRKVNAGVEAGFVYPLAGNLSAGLHLTYYLLKRLENDLAPDTPGVINESALNFRPLALKCLLAYDLN